MSSMHETARVDYSFSIDVLKALMRFFRRLSRNRLALVCLIILAVVFVVSAFPARFAPYSPTAGNLRARLLSPSHEHLLGTDQQGRDVLSRIIWGGRVALTVGFVSIGIGLVIGTVLGLFTGYFEGFLSALIMRVMDLILSFPYMLLVIAIISILGFSLFNAIIVIGIRMVPHFARLVRSIVVSLREREFIEAQRALGSSTPRILLLHILPNCLAPIIVQVTLSIGKAILTESSLSFLGMGAQPPTPSWGNMVAIGREYLVTHPYLSLVPGLTIMVVVFSLNIVGDAIRDVLDPKLNVDL